MIDIEKIAHDRYTAKHYDNTRHVSKQHLDQLLTVLRLSPSSVNLQPWHFIVVDNRTSQDKILPAVTDFNKVRVTNSTYTVIFCIKTEITDDYLQKVLDKEDEDGRYHNQDLKHAHDEGRRHFFNLNNKTQACLYEWERSQLYLALGGFLYAAAAIGIDSTAIEGYDAENMDELLGLKDKGLKSIVIATIGYRAENDRNAERPKSRLNAEDLFTFI